MSTPLVSVLISTYDRPLFLRRAIDTVVSQSVQDLEIIVRDDCGTVDVHSVIDDFQDSRILLRRNERNVGDAATNSLLYKEARGTFVAHLDDDDEWTPDFLRILTEPLQADSDLDLSFTNHTVIDAVGHPLDGATDRGRKRWGRDGLKVGIQTNGRSLAVIHRAVPTSHAAVLRRSAVGVDGFDARVGRAWDMWVASLGARRTGQVWFDPRPLSRYRVHDGQMSDIGRRRQADDSTFQGFVWCLERLTEDPSFDAEREGLLRQLASERAKWSLHKLMQGSPREAAALSRSAYAAHSTLLGYLGRVLVGLAAAAPGTAGRRTVQVGAQTSYDLVRWLERSFQSASAVRLHSFLSRRAGMSGEPR